MSRKAKATKGSVEEQLAEIEHRLDEILGTAELLLGMRLLQDGHAKTLRGALTLARDHDRLAALYPVPE